uniref:Uncharacterized protein n=1 Tax=Leersia perrieri TaxID=77586 RepID=A0A0D9VPE2_9ORYZ
MGFKPNSNPMEEIGIAGIEDTQINLIHRPIKDVTEGNSKATNVEAIGINHTVDEDIPPPSQNINTYVVFLEIKVEKIECYDWLREEGRWEEWL